MKCMMYSNEIFLISCYTNDVIQNIVKILLRNILFGLKQSHVAKTDVPNCIVTDAENRFPWAIIPL